MSTKTTTLLKFLEPASTRAEEFLFFHLLDISSSGLDKDERIMIAYILAKTPFGRLLLGRAKSLRPSLIVQGEAMQVDEILSTLDDAYTLGQLMADEEIGVNPDVHHNEHCGGYASDKAFESLIAMAKGLERRWSFSKQDRERARVVRKFLEKERNMERYVLQRDPRPMEPQEVIDAYVEMRAAKLPPGSRFVLGSKVPPPRQVGGGVHHRPIPIPAGDRQP